MREPVMEQGTLAKAIEAAFEHAPEPLAIDSLILQLADGLLEAASSSSGGATPIRVDGGAVTRARQFLDAETTRVVRSSELEAVSGLTRYDPLDSSAWQSAPALIATR